MNDDIDLEFSIVPTRGGFWLYRPRTNGVTGKFVKASEPTEHVRPMGVPKLGKAEKRGQPFARPLGARVSA